MSKNSEQFRDLLQGAVMGSIMRSDFPFPCDIDCGVDQLGNWSDEITVTGRISRAKVKIIFEVSDG